jgi:hypothetical protein
VKYGLSVKENGTILIKVVVGEKVLRKHQHPEFGKQQEDADIWIKI